MAKGKRASTGTVIIILILLLLLGLAFFYIVSQSNNAIGNIVKQAVDPCEREFQECNHECGEGILSSICKEKCSYEYRRCKG